MFVKIYTIYYNNNINCLRTQAINVYNKEKECAQFGAKYITGGNPVW